MGRGKCQRWEAVQKINMYSPIVSNLHAVMDGLNKKNFDLCINMLNENSNNINNNNIIMKHISSEIVSFVSCQLWMLIFLRQCRFFLYSSLQLTLQKKNFKVTLSFMLLMICVGYNYSEDRVVIDGKLVTSRGPGTTFEFALAIVELLVSKEKKDSLIPPMLVKL